MESPTRPATDALARLYARRALIARAREQLADVLAGGLPTAPGSWRSPAQRRYSSRLGEARRLLHQADRQLDVAAASVDRAIADYRAGL